VSDADQDPHGELSKQNVLMERDDISKTAAEFHLTVDQVQSVLHDARQQLWQRRQQRPRPHLDNKMITAWNGLSSLHLSCVDSLSLRVLAVIVHNSGLFASDAEQTEGQTTANNT